jgi:hypothetical protein
MLSSWKCLKENCRAGTREKRALRGVPEHFGNGQYAVFITMKAGCNMVPVAHRGI